MACGGHINPAYFQLLELQVSELLYHLEIVQAVQTRIHPEQTAEGKAQAWAGGDIDWE